MKRIILFRFHDYKDVCRNKLEVLRHFNPDVAIFGMFGGTEEKYEEMKSLDFDGLYFIPMDDPYWKWLCGDLCIRSWFKDYGYNVDFDMLHVVEWDLLLLQPISEFYKEVNDGVSLANIKPVEERAKEGWVWVTGLRSAEEWQRLQSFCRDNFDWDATPGGGLFPTASMSKKFLEKYVAIEVPSFCNDEVRLPIFAQSFGMNVHSIALGDVQSFNCNNNIIPVELVYKLAKENHKAFHPVREMVSLEVLSK